MGDTRGTNVCWGYFSEDAKRLSVESMRCSAVVDAKKKNYRLHKTIILSTRLSEEGCTQGFYGEV